MIQEKKQSGLKPFMKDLDYAFLNYSRWHRAAQTEKIILDSYNLHVSYIFSIRSQGPIDGDIIIL